MAWVQMTGLQRDAWTILLSNNLALPLRLQNVLDAAAEKDAAVAEQARLTQQNTDLRESLDATQDALDQEKRVTQQHEQTIAELHGEIAGLIKRLDDLTKPTPTPTPEPPPLPEPPPPTPAPEPPPEEPGPITPVPSPSQPEPQPEPHPEPPLPNPTPPPDVVQDLQLSATFHALTVTLPGAFPVPSNDHTVSYRKAGDTDWLEDLPLWSHGDRLTGSLFPLESDTAYEVRVILGGVAHGGSARTWKDERPSHAELVGAG